jgi:hypothetical protein
MTGAEYDAMLTAYVLHQIADAYDDYAARHCSGALHCCITPEAAAIVADAVARLTGQPAPALTGAAA